MIPMFMIPMFMYELRQRLLDLECFEQAPLRGPFRLDLVSTEYYILVIARKGALCIEWYTTSDKKFGPFLTDFQNVLEQVPSEIQTKLLFGLDLFAKAKSGRLNE